VRGLDIRGPVALVSRRSWKIGASLALVCGVLVVLLAARSGFAQSAAVPADLQAELLSKLAAYDRNLTKRARDGARVLIVVKPGDARSRLAAASMKNALSHVERIGGLPHQETVVAYDSALALAKLCRSERAAVIYVTPGFDDDIDALQKALVGVDVLSVSAVPDYVPRGIVLGFELVSGKPRISLNLEQSKLQNVDFKADVINLMKVYR